MSRNKTEVSGNYMKFVYFVCVCVCVNWLRHFIMRLFLVEIRLEVTIKAEVSLLIPASPWPWSQRWVLLHIQHSGIYRRDLW